MGGDVLSEGDGIRPTEETEIAVGELVRHGLAHRDGDFVFPTRAAIRLRELPECW